MQRSSFRGRRQWPQAISYTAPATKIRRPWRGVWGGLKQMPWMQDFGGYMMENSTTGALGGEARWGSKVSEKWWETVARLAPERLPPDLGNSGCARVRRGASEICPGAFRGAFGVGAYGLWPGNGRLALITGPNDSRGGIVAPRGLDCAPGGLSSSR